MTLALVFVASLGSGCGDDGGTEPTETGNVQVTLAMAGTDLDPDGCQVTVDAGSPRLLQAGESTTYADLATGSHVVQLTDVESNCEVQGESTRTVQVAADATTDVTFGLVCSALPTGSIEVTTVTTGQEIPPDGYLVVAGESFAAIGTNATVTIEDVPVGNRSVALSDFPLHCSVSGENPRFVTVTEDGAVSTTFEIDCPSHLGGYIAFISYFSGVPGDPGNPSIFIMTAEGDDLHPITGAPLEPQHPDISPNGTRILFHHVRGAGDDDLNDIYIMNADGSNPTPLTSGDWQDGYPAWSPDGTEIAFASDRDGGTTAVWIMDADGSDARKLVSFPSWTPAWSPDGTRIVFAGSGDESADLYIVNADGSNLVSLTDDAFNDNAPAWSPDGQTIAFTSSERDGNVFQDIYVVSVSGGPIVNLTNLPDSHDYNPDWSPDGTQIAFSSYRAGIPDIYVMDSQGGNVTRLTVGMDAAFPDWGPLN